MHYTDINFKTKKALKEAVAKGWDITVHNPEAFSGEAATPTTGKVAVGGPHYPAAHKWYATVMLLNGKVVKVT